MSATGLDVFDKTLQITHIWLDEIMEELGPDRQVAWRSLGAVLRAMRDRIPTELAAHLGAQLPLLVRGAYYDQWKPAREPERYRTGEEFLARIADDLSDIRPVNPRAAAEAVFRTLGKHVTGGQSAKVREAMPEEVRRMWPDGMDKAA
jgi:uncharacterized protein (DUF2267 family)